MGTPPRSRVRLAGRGPRGRHGLHLLYPAGLCPTALPFVSLRPGREWGDPARPCPPHHREQAVGSVIGTVVSPGVAPLATSQGARLRQVVPGSTTQRPRPLRTFFSEPAPAPAPSPQPPAPQPGGDGWGSCVGGPGVAGTEWEGGRETGPKAPRGGCMAVGPSAGPYPAPGTPFPRGTNLRGGSPPALPCWPHGSASPPFTKREGPDPTHRPQVADPRRRPASGREPEPMSARLPGWSPGPECPRRRPASIACEGTDGSEAGARRREASGPGFSPGGASPSCRRQRSPRAASWHLRTRALSRP